MATCVIHGRILAIDARDRQKFSPDDESRYGIGCQALCPLDIAGDENGGYWPRPGPRPIEGEVPEARLSSWPGVRPGSRIVAVPPGTSTRGKLVNAPHPIPAAQDREEGRCGDAA